ncbi:MAG: helix-turn-helix transcriptional regulator [Cyclobacteriaceae bacterium]
MVSTKLDSDMKLMAQQEHIHIKQYYEMLGESMTILNDADLGISFGKYLNLNAMGLIYEISLSCKSMSQALLVLAEYLNTNFPVVAIDNQSKGNSHLIHITYTGDPQFEKIIMDASSVFIHREIELLIDGKAVLNLEKRIINVSLNSSEINKGRITNFQYLLPAFMQVINNSDQSFPGRVRKMVLQMATPALPSADEVATQFALSLRSFQRKLTNSQTNFRALTNQIKAEMNKFLSANDQLQTKEIAYLLGYAEPSAFIHARNNW